MDPVEKILEAHLERAREHSVKGGKTEKTQEDHDRNPLVKLGKIFDDWANNHYGFHLDERLQSVQETLGKTEFSLSDLKKWHETYPQFQDPHELKTYPHHYDKEGVGYFGFLIAFAEHLKTKIDCSTLIGTEFEPFFFSKKLLPQLVFLSKSSQGAKVKLENLDTVVLYSCEYAYLSEFSGGNLVVDCDLGKLGFSSIGNDMTGGKIIIGPNAKVYSLGTRMKGGEIICPRNLDHARLGEEMKGGSIVIDGSVTAEDAPGLPGVSGAVPARGYRPRAGGGEAKRSRPLTIGRIGYGMTGGTIRIKGDVSLVADEGDSIGYGMQGGEIVIEGRVTATEGIRQVAPCDLGVQMRGGTIRVENEVNGYVHLGMYMEGNGRIEVRGNCKSHSIGLGMEGGTIEIGGNGGISIGEMMKDGLIIIRGNALQYDEKNALHTVGMYMSGGKISIDGDAVAVGYELEGGVIEIGGHLANKTDILKYGGEIYEKGIPVKPRLRWRILAKIFRKLEEITSK